MGTESPPPGQSGRVGGRLADIWRPVATAGEEVHTLSLLALVMTLLLLEAEAASPIGIAALALQVGLLIRINYLHGRSSKQGLPGR